MKRSAVYATASAKNIQTRASEPDKASMKIREKRASGSRCNHSTSSVATRAPPPPMSDSRPKPTSTPSTPLTASRIATARSPRLGFTGMRRVLEREVRPPLVVAETAFLDVPVLGVASNRAAPEGERRSIAFEHAHEPAPGLGVPYRARKTFADTCAPVAAHHEELVHVARVGIVLIERRLWTHEREPRERAVHAREVETVAAVPVQIQVVAVLSVGSRVELEPLGHVVQVVLEQVRDDHVRFTTHARHVQLLCGRHSDALGGRGTSRPSQRPTTFANPTPSR